MFERKMLNLLNVLIDKEILPIKELEQITDLTRRQIEYNVEKINSAFLSIRPKILSIDKGYIFLRDQDRNAVLNYLKNGINSKVYIFDVDERVRYLFLMLFVNYNKYLSLNHFITSLKVGKTTIQSDLKQLESLLAVYNVEISYDRKNGYSLIGNEFDIRYFLMKLIIEDLDMQTGNIVYDLFIRDNNKLQLNDISRVIIDKLSEYQLVVIEKRVRELSYILNLMLVRLEIPLIDFYNTYNLPLISKLKEFEFTKDLLKEFDATSEDAVLYISAWILGQTVGNSDKQTYDYSIINELTNRIVLRFESISGVRFENLPKVVKQLYSHLRPAYYRTYFKLPIVNPLTTVVKKEYESLFFIVKETMKPIVDLFDHNIPDDEIAYLTIHFLSLMENNNERIIHRKRAIVVCPNGIGSSAIVLNELKNLFPEIHFEGPIETKYLKEYVEQVDIIFSTVQSVHLLASEKPVLIVNPVLSTTDKYRLIREVYTEIGDGKIMLPSVDKLMEIIYKHTEINNEDSLKADLYKYLGNTIYSSNSFDDNEELSLCDIMTENLMQFNIEADNWEEAITKSAIPLLEQNYISLNYVQETIKSIKEIGPYMVITKSVALPHSKASDGVYKLGISLTTLKKPVQFNHKENDPVKYVFFLASYDNHTHIHALSQLLALLEDEQFYNYLDKANESNMISKYIEMKLE